MILKKESTDATVQHQTDPRSDQAWPELEARVGPQGSGQASIRPAPCCGRVA